jgi:hypothetical protein
MTLIDINNRRRSTPARAFEVAFTAVVFDEGSAVLDESYATRSARRDAVVDVLLGNHDEVDEAIVQGILDPFGGADADATLAQITALYGDYGVDVHLGEHRRDVGPSVLYSAFTHYGDDNSTFVEHYGTRDDRLKVLRQRAADLAEGYPAEFFDNADEEACKKVIEYRLAPTNGQLFLFEAQREAEGGAYRSYSASNTRTKE